MTGQQIYGLLYIKSGRLSSDLPVSCRSSVDPYYAQHEKYQERSPHAGHEIRMKFRNYPFHAEVERYRHTRDPHTERLAREPHGSGGGRGRRVIFFIHRAHYDGGVRGGEYSETDPK